MTQDFSLKNKQKKQTSNRLKKSDFKHHFYLESFGVKIGVSSNDAEAIEAVKKAVEIYLPDCFTEIEATKTEHHFLFVWNKSRRDTLYKNGERIASRVSRDASIENTASRIRLAVAEFAVGRVFVHAGVIAWKGKAILLPARSFRGKTTLTAEMVRRGALYYSDEYAVLDKDGFVHPFVKPLSMRGVIDAFKQIDFEVETLGGKPGTERIPVGMVLVTEYQPKKKWKPVKLSAANGTIELINNTVSIRSNPTFALEVLNKVAGQAVFIKSPRGEAAESAGLILDFFEKNCF